MRDFAFYNAGITDAKGPKRVLGLARRLVRRLLRPMFFHQEALYRDLQGQIDHLHAQVEALSRRSATSDAFRWDAVAMSRRLATIEDHLAREGCPDHPRRAVAAPGCRIDPATGHPSPHVGSVSGHPASRDTVPASGDDRDLA
ncbi:hypothetical protein AB1L88_11400 [Tautonia sp. JC769]|uniref:hypothetical protein n=1 Tax=Tautonia sp. JC769 TaxID=3232135 RepID=UPI0034584E10